MIRLLAVLLTLALPARAEEIVLGLSVDSVAITATFDGSEILIFGAVKRDAPAPAGAPLEVVIAVAGPEAPATVRRKERVAGIWMNRTAVEIDSAPVFYAVATTGPLAEVLTETEDLRHRVSIERAVRSIGNLTTDAPAFAEALIRIRTEEGRYRLMEGAVELTEETLFRTAMALPANLVEGSYAARIFITRAGAVIDSYETEIAVAKVGLERWLFNLSRNQPFAYGVLSLILAAAAGWAASAAVQALRR